ncbi:hypothetical protein B0H14DRAFT_2573391 [Mycena olivaceomarginata]|nr:hypothetical protein B0H14DRAFT_2573391 [Mycena olivaceomarginata]
MSTFTSVNAGNLTIRPSWNSKPSSQLQWHQAQLCSVTQKYRPSWTWGLSPSVAADRRYQSRLSSGPSVNVVTILAVPGLYFGTMFSRLHRQLVVIIGRRIDNFREGREIHKQQEVYLVNKIDERDPEFHVRELGKRCIVSQVVRPDKVDDYMVLIVELDMGASCGCPAESLTAKGRGSPLPTVLGKGLQSPGVQELV